MLGWHGLRFALNKRGSTCSEYLLGSVCVLCEVTTSKVCLRPYVMISGNMLFVALLRSSDGRLHIMFATDAEHGLSLCTCVLKEFAHDSLILQGGHLSTLMNEGHADHIPFCCFCLVL